MQRTIQKVMQNCLICTRNNPKAGPPPIFKEVQTRGTEPRDAWQIDFTVMPRAMGHYRYLLVFVDTFTGWVKAFLCWREKAS